MIPLPSSIITTKTTTHLLRTVSSVSRSYSTMMNNITTANVRRVCVNYMGLTLFSSVVGTTTAVVLCEGSDKDNKNKSILDIVLPKNADGATNWSKATNQITDNFFWDQLGTATGRKVQSAIDSGIPTQLSYGFISGYCSGMALKKVGKAVSVVLGFGFMTLQTLSFYGYVKVDHTQIQKDVHNILDLNDDGVIDKQDGTIAYNKLMKVLQYNMPAGSGFAAGFIGGMRSG